MDITEQYESILESEELIKRLDASEYSILPSIWAEPLMNASLEDAKEELLNYPDVFKREPYQMYRRFQALFRCHYDLLVNVHPLTSVGKERIIEWRKAVDDYEALSGSKYPLVTTVTEDSVHLISHLIPKEFTELIGNNKRHILCATRYKPTDEEVKSYVEFALKEREAVEKGEEVDYTSFTQRTDHGGVVPAGVLCFKTEDTEDGITVHIEWLYVAKEHRNAGLCNALMYEMLHILKDMPIEAVIMDVDQSLMVSDGEPHVSTEPTTALFKEAGVEIEEEEFDPEKEFSPLVHFISNFKFESGPMPENAVHIKLSDVHMLTKMLMVPKKAKEIHPLSELDDLSFKRIVSRLIISNPGVWDEQLPYVGKGRFDQNLSFYYEDDEEIAGIVLTRKNYENDLVVELIMATKSEEKICEMLLNRTISESYISYPPETNLIIPIHHETVLNIMESHVDNMYYRMGAKAALIRPTSDITTEEWDELVESLQVLSSEELIELSRDLSDGALQ